MTNNTKKSIGLAIVASILLILVTIVLLQEKKISYQTFPEEVVVVKVEPVSVENSLQLQIRDTIVLFAKQFMDVPYEYGSCDPEKGFDCSGFVYFVFNHFGISSPRSSKNFVNAGSEVDLDELQIGDVLVFTGTDVSTRVAGHVGIVLSVDDSIFFIHSSSGSANGVTISSLEEPHYRKRFLVARDLISM